MAAPNIVAVNTTRSQAIVSLAVTPVAVTATASSAEQSFILTGLAVGDFVEVNPQVAVGAGLSIASARVSAANTLTISYMNATAGSLTPAADTYLVSVIRSYPVVNDFMVNGKANWGAIPSSNP
jgi:hypothetical protein